MDRDSEASDAPNVCLILIRAANSVLKYAEAELERSGLSSTDFRILEALLHKGPLPVNVIGPKVALTAGSISVAIDRLEHRGLVSREECDTDRRVRTVALTVAGQKVIAPVYEQHALLLERILEPFDALDRKVLKLMLKVVGKRAETLSQ